MELKWKIWLEENENKIFGEGPKELLSKVDKLGSLRQAAVAMNMSYSKAWNVISMIEDNLGVKLLEKQAGGSSGGGSQLTQEGREILNNYRQLEIEVEEQLEKIFAQYF
ncbi:MAG: winged helix-turn-helix domain-containing protein [Bacillota bacterium]